MSYWLLKTEPGEYSFGNLQRDKYTSWNGVTNNLALKHMRSMKKGDKIFIYHTRKEKRIVGIASASIDPYPDPRSRDGKLVVIDIAPEHLLKRPVTLSEIRADSAFSALGLVRSTRLSVMPVSSEEWNAILKRSEDR